MKHESTKHYSGGLDTKRRTCAKKKEREPPIYLATCNYQAASSFTFHITPYSSIVVYCLSSSCTSCMVLYSLPLEVIPSGSMFKKKEQKHELPAVPCHCLPPRSKRTTSKSVRTVGIYIYNKGLLDWTRRCTWYVRLLVYMLVSIRIVGRIKGFLLMLTLYTVYI